MNSPEHPSNESISSSTKFSSPQNGDQEPETNELDFKLAVDESPGVQLYQLSNWLDFEPIMLPNVNISYGNEDFQVGYYKLLKQFNKLVLTVCQKNNELNVVKFKCKYLIDEMIKEWNEGEESEEELNHAHIKVAKSEVAEKLKDFFDPKEEFESTAGSSF
ncbi:uncharacterized protein SPAPADRAFT_66856 [Spathaspora passalidarum NRRL Y-27907]|uniref:Uncharacterized protein n=1 Tax=Spathaspora passalidarum (strain NRRL Y-27907 / 11-Y1) TaxID=619300 RepID=G3APP5_SPAPN|nr:uncharacterized protein SPAPADRAFT_66856 [Spathaspora passalidarum NRRL Y-27907]EGW32216.1 hypothetical protein SPAPADRAFT_66856 [Spathaspora passalidarum NRRL Y-27907]